MSSEYEGWTETDKNLAWWKRDVGPGRGLGDGNGINVS
jgi:hypothetical protein